MDSTVTADQFTPLHDPLVPTPEYAKDPYRNYTLLREKSPMYKSPWGLWVASRYEEIAFLLRDKRFGRGYFYFEGLAARQGEQILEEPIYKGLRNTMVMKDDEPHRRLRGLVSQAFSHRRVEQMRPMIAANVDELLDKMATSDDVDLMRDFAFSLPNSVNCDMVGIPKEDQRHFSERAINGSRVLEPAPLSPEELQEQNAANAAFDEYFEYLYKKRKVDPQDDLVSAFIHAEIDGEQLTYEEIRDNTRMFFIGGQETTVNTIGNGLHALFSHPDQLSKLKSDFGYIASAVEEMIRFNPSVHITPRQALEDIEIAGAAIKRGETILCMVASASRDPALYNNPDVFDITRENIKPIAFGGGPHFCIGAQLGRIEAQIAIQKLLERFPTLDIQDLESPQWLDTTVVFRGLKLLKAHI